MAIRRITPHTRRPAGGRPAVAVWLALCALAIAGQSTSFAAVVPVGLQVSPTTDDVNPTATTSFQAWERFTSSTRNVYAVPRAGGSMWKVNAARTFGAKPFARGGTQTIIYQQFRGSASSLFFYNLSTRARKSAGAKVNTAAWEYWGVASKKYIAFMRETRTARNLLLFNRSTGRLKLIVSAKRSCSFCLTPEWVGASHLVYSQCSQTTFACQERVLTIGGATVTAPRGPAPHSNYGGALDEATGNLYYISTTSYCGLFATIEEWNISGGAPGSVYDFAEGIDGNGTSLAPDVGTPGNSDLLFSQFDCLAQDSDNYEIDSVNTVTPTAQPQAALGTPAATGPKTTPRAMAQASAG
jgi:hypothetical protein